MCANICEQVLLLAIVGSISAQCNLPVPLSTQNVQVICPRSIRCNANNSAIIPTVTVIRAACLKNYEIRGQSKGFVNLRCNGTSWIGQTNFDEMRCKIKCGQINMNYFGPTINRTMTMSGRLMYPWHVGIFRNNSYICGGSIVNPFGNELLILTAAHCLITDNKMQIIQSNQLKIVVGALNSNFSDNLKMANTQILDVKDIVINKNYDSTMHTNDVAIIQTEKPIQISSYSLPICLPNHGLARTEEMKTNNAFFVGFGNSTKDGQIPTEEIREFQVPVLRTQSCIETLDLIPDVSQVCSGDVGVADANQSSPDKGGGGLIFKDHFPARYTIQGIVGTVPDEYKCRGAGAYMFTQVFSFIGWIEDESENLIFRDDYDSEESESMSTTATSVVIHVRPQSTTPITALLSAQTTTVTSAPAVQRNRFPTQTTGIPVQQGNYKHSNPVGGCDPNECHEKCLASERKPGVCSSGFYKWKLEISCYCNGAPRYASMIDRLMNNAPAIISGFNKFANTQVGQT